MANIVDCRRFSVVIPLYNKSQYVSKAVESVLAQTHKEFELIIINDGSSDNSLEEVQKLQDHRLKVISQPNSGVSVARNNGVKAAQHDYIAFLDADDWWHPTFLEEMSVLINTFPSAGLYGSSYEVVKNQIHRRAEIALEDRFSGYIDYFKIYAATFWVPINCSFVVVKKLIFEEMKGFKAALKFGEDLDLWIRIALKHQVAYINKCLAFSNQDVETANRALGGEKCWRKEEHVIFNLDYLQAEELRRPNLKYLLDGLRLRSMQDFYLTAAHKEEVVKIINRIDFSEHSFLYRFIYRWPKPIVSIYFWFKGVGSVCKQAILVRIRPQ